MLASSSGLDTADRVSYLKEYEHTTLVRVLLASDGPGRSTHAEAIGLLERLIAAARAGGRNGSLIELLVIRALAHQAEGAASAAADALEEAVGLAEPEGFCRVFTREALLERAWGYRYAGGTRTVDIHVRRVRSKLGDMGSVIETVRNVGYKMRG